MPFGSEGVQDGLALALSGGGFRATLFHIGTLLRLNELGVLSKLDRISSVSGGSITAGMLARSWSTLTWEKGVALNLVVAVIEPLRAFCRLSIDAPAIGEGLLLPWKRASDVVREAYEDHLFGNYSLRELPDRPRFVINATNLQTGRSFRFSKPYMGDYRLGLIRDPNVSLSLAVAASSAFPPVLSPLEFDAPGAFQFVKGADLNANPSYTRKLYLTDGGAYDNLGLETVWNRYKTVLVSDAGAPFGIGEEIHTDWLAQARRALDIATDQSRALRKRALIDDFKRATRDGSYWGIETKITNYGLADAMPCDPAIVGPLAQIRTRLNKFSDDEQGHLVNWGYALCDGAIRKHVGTLIPAGTSRPTKWPCPNQPLDSL
jgi:NTE family protein